MTLNSVNLNNSINFRNNPESKSDIATDNMKSDFEKSPEQDSFRKETTDKSAEKSKVIEPDNQTEKEIKKETDTQPKKNKHLIRNIIIGVIALPVIIYGGVVLKHKFSKPTFDEIQKCFKEIFERDLSKDEVNNLLDKYKQLLKNENTEDFAKQMVEQLKKDYGIEKVQTDINVELLKDGKIKTMIEHRKNGEASPFGEINIMPSTNSKEVIRSQQKEILETGFHEVKHLKQFAEAYCADPDKFADAIYEHNVTKELIDEFISIVKAEIKKNATESLNEEPVRGMTLAKIEKLLTEATLKKYGGSFEEFAKQSIKKDYKEVLDSKFGKLERYKEGTEEYKKGMEYIEAYKKYPDPEKDYSAYKNNLLEKEAWNNGDLSKKIYDYLKSIWSI